MATTKTATKQADIRYRVALKNNANIIVYKVRSSDDTKDYEVTLLDGKVCNCTCPAKKPCYHMRDVQAKEDSRNPVAPSEKGALNGSCQGFSLMR